MTQMPTQEAKYLQVMEWVRKGIESGRFRSGDRLPSEAQLSSMFGLSRQTIRHATGELESARLVTRVQGSGTYIAQIPDLLSEPEERPGQPQAVDSPAVEPLSQTGYALTADGYAGAQTGYAPTAGSYAGEPLPQTGYAPTADRYVAEPLPQAGYAPAAGVPAADLIRSAGPVPAGHTGQGNVKRARTATHNIAVVSTFYESYIFPQTLKGIEHVLAKNGYAMQVSFTDNRLNRERSILESILEKDNIDGMIVEPAKSALPNPNLGYYQAIRDRGIPILFFNASYRDFPAPCVRIDDVKIASKATQVLIDHGHQRLAGIFKGDDRQGPLRYQGFVETILRAGLKVRHEQVLWLDTPMTVNVSVIEDYLFSRIQGCTGVLCYNDEVGYQVIELALHRGIRVPEDLSVIGIDDSYLAGVGKVPLTSFPHPKEELGRKVSQNMLRMIEDPGFDANWLFDSELVLRDSVAGIFPR